MRGIVRDFPFFLRRTNNSRRSKSMSCHSSANLSPLLIAVSIARISNPDRLPGRPSDSQIANNHPSAIDRRACRAHPRGHVLGERLRPANQLRRLVRFTDQMAAAGMRNVRSHSRSQMRIDTSCDVAKLAVTLAQGRVLEPERRSNPFTRSSLRTGT